MMMLPIVSGTLTVARAIKGLTIEEVAEMAGVIPQDVFEVENSLEDADWINIVLIATALNVDLNKLNE